MNIETNSGFGMHYRRMDPQPPQSASVHEGTRNGRRIVEVNGPGVAFDIERPADMPHAESWCDRDGEWYWRTEIVR